MSTPAAPETERDEEPADPRASAGPRGLGPWVWLIVGAALILAGAGAIIMSTAFNTPHRARTLPPNLPVNDGATNALDLSANNSPTIVQSPANHANVVVANRVDSPFYSCGLHVSFDGGGHWTQSPIPAPAGAKECYAPDAAFAKNGALYVSYVTLKGRAHAPNAVYITRSSDGGKTLSPPIKTPLRPSAFQVRLTADPVVAGRLYLTWLQASGLGLYRFSGTGNPIMTSRSDDGGAHWSSATQVSGPGRARVVAPSPVAGRKRGELYVAYLDLGNDTLDYAGEHHGRGGPPYAGKWQLVVARSRNRGSTWRESVVDANIAPTERFIVFTPPSPSLALDRRSGELYASFQDRRSGDADVLLWRLPQGASHWQKAKRVNDTPKPDGTSQYLPALAVAPDGRVDVVYYDRRSDRTNVLNDVSLQSSYDHGKTFAHRVSLSDKSFSSRIGFGLERGLPDLGSRLGLVSNDRRAYAVWTDTRAGSIRSAKQDLGRGIVAFNDPARLSGLAKALLLIGGIGLLLAGIFLVVSGAAAARARASAEAPSGQS
jgi:hypothetical protein